MPIRSLTIFAYTTINQESIRDENISARYKLDYSVG